MMTALIALPAMSALVPLPTLRLHRSWHGIRRPLVGTRMLVPMSSACYMMQAQMCDSNWTACDPMVTGMLCDRGPEVACAARVQGMLECHC